MNLDKKEQESIINSFNKELTARLEKFLTFETTYRSNNDVAVRNLFEKMSKHLNSATYTNKPSEILKSHYMHVVDAYIPAAYQQSLFYIVDKQIEFPYSRGWNRRTVRTKKSWNFVSYKLNRLFESYYNISFFSKSVYEYYTDTDYRFSLTSVVSSYNLPNCYELDSLIAAELDLNQTNLAAVIEDILLSENNVNIVSTDIIRGIIMSNNTHLHDVLAKFLLAARLQEGVRQAVCENMDCGTSAAFISLLKIIDENDLVRFSSVKRAISTWTGLCNEEHIDRITNKQLNIITRAVKDKEYVNELLKSNDNIELYLGLWALGFYEVEDAIATCKEIMDNGTKNQRLVISYYNISLQDSKFTDKVANYVFDNFSDDLELCAAFLPTYMTGVSSVAYDALCKKTNSSGYYYSHSREFEYKPVEYFAFFDSMDQAKRHYDILTGFLNEIPKKGLLFSPCIFPWYSVKINADDIAMRLAMITYIISEDSYTDNMLPYLSLIDTYNRSKFLRLLLHKPANSLQKNALIQALSDKAPDTRSDAYLMLKYMTLTSDDFELIKTFAKYKSKDIREHVLDLLKSQNDDGIYNTVVDLTAAKNAEMRLAGLDLIVQVKKDENKKDLYQKCVKTLNVTASTTAREKIIIEELTNVSEADSILNKPGFGLYNPEAATFEIKELDSSDEYYKEFFKAGDINKLCELYKKLDAYYESHSNLEYCNASGYEYLLKNAFYTVKYGDEEEYINKYPFPELWISFYNDNIHDFETLLRMYILNCIHSSGFSYSDGNKSKFIDIASEIYTRSYIDFEFTDFLHKPRICSVIDALYLTYAKRPENRALVKKLTLSVYSKFTKMPIEMTYYETKNQYSSYVSRYYACNTPFFRHFNILNNWTTDEEFDEFFNFAKAFNNFYNVGAIYISSFDYIKAYTRNLISYDYMYKMFFDKVSLSKTLQELGNLACPGSRRFFTFKQYINTDGEMEDNIIYKKGIEIYYSLVDMILKVELKRSETDTPFSKVICSIPIIKGANNLVDILLALGDDTLERSVYYRYYSSYTDKRSCLSHLLKVCVPNSDEDSLVLASLLKKNKISDKRLVETAMYNHKWIDHIENYLSWPGFKSGIFYFVAHMNESFSEQTKALIAKYTPLSSEELNKGAFDITWFKECYKLLGEKRFKLLYDSAKYISESNMHTRARKYADAALGKISSNELEVIISDKRNKDLLMSYPLVPIKNDNEVLHRYQFLQKFLKESKQFGAQRRASESLAVSMGLQNLATNSGYSDVTRLTLNMETKLVDSYTDFFNWHEIDEIRVKLSVNELGSASIICEKNGKQLKSIPAKYKKHAYIVDIKEIAKELKAQYSRTKALMEQFMEDGILLNASEIKNLLKNPVITPILKNLVYISDDFTGFFDNMQLVSFDNSAIKLTPKKKLRIAHPFDLWKFDVWSDYQKYLFANEIKQPFKQVFRELYVKTDEELEKEHSLRYAGNQIQPGRTIGCLKGRRWVADYEDGLQKIYYKENIVARIYALADWFSPSDIEAPTLEWVEFSDRNTYKSIKIKDVPDRIFSEVMRDVDLAVSVAHAGGVDPETSHSTMEMRKAIIEFNLPLFGLTNVSFAGNHALIEGKRGSYTVHLGSGVIFKQGGAQIAVLPVHSQHRGKLFLPFIDEDPKTAEIMSKIVLFAEDMKIKDPYILNQL